MVLNGLGFVGCCLYLSPEFFDYIAAYDPIKLFNAIAARCLLASDYETYCLHVDTTPTFSVTGDYDAEFVAQEMTVHQMTVTYGHPKDVRCDLKQFVLGMTTDQHGILLFLQMFSGNESDKKTLLTIITQLTENLRRPGEGLHIVDAAFDTAENHTTLGTPHLLDQPGSGNPERGKGPHHRGSRPAAVYGRPLLICETRIRLCQHFAEVGGVSLAEQQEKTFEQRLERDKKKAEISLRKLNTRVFACELDTQIAAGKWLQEYPLFRFRPLELRTITRKQEMKRGRPKAGEPVEAAYTVSVELDLDPGKIEYLRQILGGFILATNDLALSVDDFLANYKGPGTVERGFRFLKDKSFQVAEFYLKKPSWIQALAMVMVLCLFVYEMTEFWLRWELQTTGEMVTGQTKKQTQNPTLKWMFFRFRKVRKLKFQARKGGDGHRYKYDPELWKILRPLGRGYKNYYIRIKTCGIRERYPLQNFPYIEVAPKCLCREGGVSPSRSLP